MILRKKAKKDTLECLNAFYDGREMTFNAVKSEIFPLAPIEGTGLKILTPIQILEWLAIALAQVKAGNASENLLNEICHIEYSLFWAKLINIKVYNNIMNSIKVWYKMHIIFINSENSKTSDAHRLLLNLSDKIDLKRSDKNVA